MKLPLAAARISSDSEENASEILQEWPESVNAKWGASSLSLLGYRDALCQPVGGETPNAAEQGISEERSPERIHARVCVFVGDNSEQIPA